MEAEATARIGAEWGERTDARTAYRNGHRDKTVTTQAGDRRCQVEWWPSRAA
ncbi:transposase [Streptomyces sp. M2CJ-2]|uniref:transposase n=1 Tax=Streptomyces sp. M2CJ-2 TaxID=2803948 RepID=UPI0027DC9BEC|nr:transposase [Streptomyces sp. M2CJ-2]